MITIYEDPNLPYIHRINVDEISLETAEVVLKNPSSYSLLLKRLHFYDITAGLDGSEVKRFGYNGNERALTVNFRGDIMQAMHHLQLEHFVSDNTLHTLLIIQRLKTLETLNHEHGEAFGEPQREGVIASVRS